MDYRQFECDFILRTLKIIEQYETFVEKKVPDAEKYEVTLLINCFVGLLILPHELHFKRNPSLSLIKLEEWGLPKDFVKSWGEKKDNERDIREIIRHMRNSIAHLKIKPIGNGSDIISIRLWDTNTSGEKITFEGEISVDCLKKFIKKFAQTILLEYCKSKK